MQTCLVMLRPVKPKQGSLNCEKQQYAIFRGDFSSPKVIPIDSCSIALLSQDGFTCSLGKIRRKRKNISILQEHTTGDHYEATLQFKKN